MREGAARKRPETTDPLLLVVLLYIRSRGEKREKEETMDEMKCNLSPASPSGREWEPKSKHLLTTCFRSCLDALILLTRQESVNEEE